MSPKWIYRIGAVAVVLLTVGAGCADYSQQGALAPNGTGGNPPANQPSTAPTGEQGAPAATGPSADVDAAADAAIKEVDDQTAASMQENADANVVSNDSAELNAYDQAYDPSKL